MLIPREDRWIRASDLNLHVVTAGPSDGPLVILLHGFPEFWYGWRYQIDPLVMAGFRVWVPDQRGYNLSDKPASIRDYDIRLLTRDISHLIEAAGEQKAHIVGHDWGGNVAWWLALLYPERVERLTLLNTPHPQVMQKHLRTNPRQLLRSWYGGAFQMPILPELVMSVMDFELLKQVFALTGRTDAFNPGELEQYRRAWSQPSVLSSMLNWYRAYIQYPPERPPSWQVAAPTYLIWGEKDLFMGVEMAEPSLAYCDDARLTRIESATHWVQHEEPERVNRLLVAWLKGEEPDPAP